MKSFVLLCLFICAVSGNNLHDGHCVLRGVCEETDFGGVYCLNKTSPTPLKRTPDNIRAFYIIERMCPHLIDIFEDPTLCCDVGQLESFYLAKHNYLHLELDRCQQCQLNFQNLFCQMICSPKQNTFIRVNRAVKNEARDLMASEIDYYISKSLAVGVYDSCKHVTHPQGKVLDLMCGGFSAEECDIDKWFDFIGRSSDDEGVLPFKINFILSDEEIEKRGRYQFTPFTDHYYRCSDYLRGESCECEDCPDACKTKFRAIWYEQVELVKENKRLKRGGSCLMKGVCSEGAFGSIPCVSSSGPERLSDPVALVELKEMCPHLAQSPTVCCNEEQLIHLNQTFELLTMFLKECPSCVRNFERIFCHLYCSTDQSNFMRITKTEKNEDDQVMVKEIEYFVNDDWIKGVFDSCNGVHRLGFNVMDHYCKPYKAEDCDHQKFLDFIGSDHQHFGHSPFEIKFIYSNDDTVKVDSAEFKPAKQSFYKCSDNPHTGEGACPCAHCFESCPAGQKPEIKKELPKFKNSEKRSVDESIRSKREDKMCFLQDICDESVFGAIPCVKNSPPLLIQNPVALEELKEMCPHLADNPMVCCTSDQIIRLNQTFELISTFLSECPACIRNFEKVFCHLTCSPDQKQFLKIAKTRKNDDGQEAASEVQYFINDDWSRGVFDSCKNVHRLGFNVLDHYCKPFKAEECDHQKFLSFIGADHQHFGHSPYEISFVFSKDEKVNSDGIDYSPAKESFYKCSDNPHTGEGSCPCVHCDESCSGDPNQERKKALPKYSPKTKRQAPESPSSTGFEVKNKRQATGQCFMTGICGEAKYGKIPCATSVPPLRHTDFTEEAVEEFKEMCPHLDLARDGICCDREQIIHLNESFDIMERALEFCPACLRNLEKFMCHLICSADQSKFARIIKTEMNEKGSAIPTEIEYFVSEYWAKGVYESCKNIKIFGIDIRDLHCKPFDKETCDYKKWLARTYADARHGGKNPFEIYFNVHRDKTAVVGGITFEPVNQSFYHCWESTSAGDEPCPCEHCRKSCSKKSEETMTAEESEVPVQELEKPPHKREAAEGQCLFNGFCKLKNGKFGNIPCVGKHPPEPLTDPKAIEMLMATCPELAPTKEAPVCCSDIQIKRLQSNFKLVEQLGLQLCPACLNNFRKVLCFFGCSPHQDQLLHIVNTTTLEDGQLQLDTVEYFIHQDYAQGVYDSCKDIRNGSSLNMMCGKWGRKKQCSAERLFGAIGTSTKNGGFSPFQMNVKLTGDEHIAVDGVDYTVMNEKTVVCNESPTPGVEACPCQHCKAACN